MSHTWVKTVLNYITRKLHGSWGGQAEVAHPCNLCLYSSSPCSGSCLLPVDVLVFLNLNTQFHASLTFVPSDCRCLLCVFNEVRAYLPSLSAPAWVSRFSTQSHPLMLQHHILTPWKDPQKFSTHQTAPQRSTKLTKCTLVPIPERRLGTRLMHCHTCIQAWRVIDMHLHDGGKRVRD